MIQRKAVVDDVIMTQAKGVETESSDAIIPDNRDPSSPGLSSTKHTDILTVWHLLIPVSTF